MTNEVTIICTGITLVTAMLAGGFAVCAANVWLTNKREERRAREDRAARRNDSERMTWSAMLADRDEQIASLQAEVKRLTSLCDFSGRLLRESESRRIKKEETC